MSASDTVALSRKELEQILTFMRLNENVHTVTIVHSRGSGIGMNTIARFYSGNSMNFHEIEVTDYGEW